MKQHVILVTGATDGIGRQTALELARRGAEVFVHGRSPDKARRVAKELGRELDREALPSIAADLASLDEVRRMAAELLDRAPGLDVLVHNAGVFENERHLTVDGFERTFQVNHLAPFLLTHLLLDRLRANAPSRVVCVASIAHQRGRIELDDLQSARRYDGYGAYAASKLANVLFANELARRLGDAKVACFSLHPGVITTKLLQKGFGMGGDTVESGARTSVYAALDPALEGRTALYFSDQHEAQSSARSRDPRLMADLYDASCRLTQIPGLPA